MRTINIALLAAIALSARSASADVPPPGFEECRARDAGASCTLGSVAGTCRETTCSRLDYLNWNRDASATPPTVTYACVLCQTTSASDAGNDASTTPPTPASNGGCSVADVGRAVGPWALAAIPLALALRARRRRASK